MSTKLACDRAVAAERGGSQTGRLGDSEACLRAEHCLDGKRTKVPPAMAFSAASAETATDSPPALTVMAAKPASQSHLNPNSTNTHHGSEQRRS